MAVKWPATSNCSEPVKRKGHQLRVVPFKSPYRETQPFMPSGQ